MSIKFLVLGGVFWVGGGKCRFYFHGRGDFSEIAHVQRETKGVENSGEGKACHKTPPQRWSWTPRPVIGFHPPSVHVMSLSLEETGTDQTIPTFCQKFPPKGILEGALYSTFPPPQIVRYVLPPICDFLTCIPVISSACVQGSVC